MSDDHGIVGAGAARGAGLAGPAAGPLYKQRREEKAAAGEFVLAPRHKLLAEYMTFGTQHARAQRLGLPLNTPLSLADAARVVDLRLRNARQISGLPAFQRLIVELTNSIRSGEYGRSIHTLIDVRDTVGENSAADRKMRIEAAKTLMGEEAKGASVNVHIRNTAVLSPGYIIDLTPQDRPKTIDATPGEAVAMRRTLEDVTPRASLPGEMDIAPAGPEDMRPEEMRSADGSTTRTWSEPPDDGGLYCSRCGATRARGRPPCGCFP